MEHQDPHKNCYKGLGRWYSWDTPFGLSLSFFLTLTTIGVFILLLRIAAII